MDDDASENISFELSGLRLSPTDRPELKKPNNKRKPAKPGWKGHRDIDLDKAVLSQQGKSTGTPRLPLELLIYSHKKAREAVARRVLRQIARDRKRRLVLKKALLLELSPRTTVLHRNVSPHQQECGPDGEVSGGERNVEENGQCEEVAEGDSVRVDGGLSYVSFSNRDSEEPLDRQRQSCQQDRGEQSGSSSENNPSDDKIDDSHDSIAINSVSSSNRSHGGQYQQKSKTSTKNLFPPLHESYSGYVHKNKKISLTKRWLPAPLVFSPTYHRRTASPTERARLSLPAFHWANMDTRRFPEDDQLPRLLSSSSVINH